MAINSELRKRYVLAPTTYPWTEFDTPEEAIDVARERIAKNQRCYGGARVNIVYAICRVEAYVRPIRPQIQIEIIDGADSPHDSLHEEMRAILNKEIKAS